MESEEEGPRRMGTTNEVRQMRRAELRGEESGTRKRMGEEGGDSRTVGGTEQRRVKNGWNRWHPSLPYTLLGGISVCLPTPTSASSL